MRLSDVLEAAHVWMETVKIEYESMLEVEILADTEDMFRVTFENDIWYQEEE